MAVRQTVDSVYFYLFGGYTTVAINACERYAFKAPVTLLPLCEGFTSATFPPTNWSLVYTGTLYWTRDVVSGYGIGVGSAKFEFYSAGTGITQGLITSTFPATTGNTDSLRFQHAYCTFTTENDQLQIQTSTNAGTSWTTLILLDGGVSGPLVTAPPQASPFTPTASQWGRKSFGLPVGTNKVRFNAISAFGNNLFLDSICVGGLVGVHNPIGLVPGQFSLSQNYPNPFNPTTTIQFNMPKAGNVEIKVFDILGREVATLVNEFKPVGVHSVNFNASNLSSGVYFYTMKSADFTITKKMLLVK
jgi:hypothetical protein